MNLGADNGQGSVYETRERGLVEKLPWLSDEKKANLWLDHCGSEITYHDGDCCRQARSWFLGWARSMDSASLVEAGVRAPTWLSQRFEWGPSRWPIAWCELIEQKVIDCGVFAALAREVFQDQGLSVFPAQVVLQYGEKCTQHWSAFWKLDPLETKAHHRTEDSHELFPWIGVRHVYHEICVVESSPGVARFYDSTWGNWYLPHPSSGFGAVLAIRSFAPQALSWGKYEVESGEWLVVS
jgi:hypothetical protein